MRDKNEWALADELQRNGELFLPDDHPKLKKRTSLQLFRELSDELIERNRGENHDLEMLCVEGGWLITAAAGDSDDTEPDFSPPEPSSPW